MAANMPPAEIDVDADLVRALLRDQRPDLAELAIELIAFGWDNVSFRVGREVVARLPRRALAAALVDHEVRWLPELAGKLPLPVPVPLFAGGPGPGYPWVWTLVPWIPGESAARAELDLRACAADLAEFLRALHRLAPKDAPGNPFRGVPLLSRDELTRERIDQLEAVIDAPAARALWKEALSTAKFDDRPIWLHGDLHPHNMLAVEGRLSGVIDFGDITAGDPATDLSVAWIMFPAAEREIFMDAYGQVDDGTWARAKGWALSLATAYMAHGADNSTMTSVGVRAMGHLLAGP
jgi:aminoglycoside phosphotransferase (APT) family kinase protein